MFGHPETYLLVLPAFGIVGQVIPTFSHKPVFGYLTMVYAMVALGVGGLMAWGRHMFDTGLMADAQAYYAIATVVIAVPASLKILSLAATMWGGSITFRTPMLFACGFIALFVVGGTTGLFMAAVGGGEAVRDAHYQVAHFHYVLSLGAVAGLFAGFYYWLGKMSGRQYPEWAGKVHFWLFFVGANLTFLPMHFLSLFGAPAGPAYESVASIGACIGAAGYAWFIGVALYTLVRGSRTSEANYWGEGADTLEWTLPTPVASARNGQTPRITQTVR
jgi:cytochrome c oxidase subunit 1